MTSLRWLRNKVRRLLWRLRCPGMQRSAEWVTWYQNLYRSVGERALQSGRPGERPPELVLHDMKGNHQPLSRCWDKQPALLVTMSVSCGQTRRFARDLRRLARRFEKKINTVAIYVVEAHPMDAPSPYTDGIWVTTKNEIAGLHRPQPLTLAERIDRAHQLKRRYRLPIPILIDALDDRAWRSFGSAPNVALLIDRAGRIAAKQGWFDPKEMARAITALLENPPVAAAERTSDHA